MCLDWGIASNYDANNLLYMALYDSRYEKESCAISSPFPVLYLSCLFIHCSLGGDDYLITYTSSWCFSYLGRDGHSLQNLLITRVKRYSRYDLSRPLLYSVVNTHSYSIRLSLMFFYLGSPSFLVDQQLHLCRNGW
jgi:hypothetical protein